jgi:hypothetical protein
MTTERLSARTRLLIAGDGVSSLGTGLVLPLTLVYLHQVRGIALPVVGALLAVSAAAGLVANPLSGVAMDRFGAQPVLIFGASMGPTFPAINMMMVGINPDPRHQQRAFAVNFTVLNAGIGIGGTVGAAVANVHRHHRGRPARAVDRPAVRRLPRHRPARPAPGPPAHPRPGPDRRTSPRRARAHLRVTLTRCDSDSTRLGRSGELVP